MKHLFRLYSAAILTLALILCSCSGFMNGQTCSVSFQFDGEEMGKIIKGSGMSRQGDGSGMYMQVSLLGVYNASQTAIFADEMTFEFDDVPVGIPVRAYAKIYVTESGEASVTEHIRYSGESEEIVVESGENYLKVILGPPHTVQFQTAVGAAFDSQTVEYGKTVAKPSDPTSTGIFFAGWYKDSGYTNRFDFSEPITQDLTLYAKWVATLGKPVIKYYSDATYSTQLNPTNDNQDPDPKYKTYSNYNVNVDNSGNANLYYKVRWPGDAEIPADVTVTVNCQKSDGGSETKGSTGSLALGPYILKIQVSKTGYVSQEFEDEKVYVQGILTEPTFLSSNGSKREDSGSGSSMADAEKWQFSYLDYDVMECYINPGNRGNDITVYSGSDELNVDDFSLAPDITHYLRIVQTKNYCKTLETKKYVNVTIKPITVEFKTEGDNLQLKLEGFGETTFKAKGVLSIVGPNNSVAVWNHNNVEKNVIQGVWCTLEDSDPWSDTFTSTNQTIKVMLYNFRRHRGGVNQDVPFTSGEHHFPDLTLSDIKQGKGEDSIAETEWTYICDMADRSGVKVQPKIKFDVSE